MGDEPETVLLHLVSHRCRGRWRRTTLPPHQVRGIYVQIGQLLADGRWYVDVTKSDGDECRPVANEKTARQVAAAWMRHLGGQWERVPCYPTQGWQDDERADQPSIGSQE